MFRPSSPTDTGPGRRPGPPYDSSGRPVPCGRRRAPYLQRLPCCRPSPIDVTVAQVVPCFRVPVPGPAIYRPAGRPSPDADVHAAPADLINSPAGRPVVVMPSSIGAEPDGSGGAGFGRWSTRFRRRRWSPRRLVCCYACVQCLCLVVGRQTRTSPAHLGTNPTAGARLTHSRADRPKRIACSCRSAGSCMHHRRRHRRRRRRVPLCCAVLCIHRCGRPAARRCAHQ